MWTITKKTGGILSKLESIKDLVGVLKGKKVWTDDWREDTGDKKEILSTRRSLQRYFDLIVPEFEAECKLNPTLASTANTFEGQFGTFLIELNKIVDGEVSIDKKIKFINSITVISQIISVTISQVSLRQKRNEEMRAVDVSKRQAVSNSRKES